MLASVGVLANRAGLASPALHVREAAFMLRSTARRKVTWGAMVSALVVGLALLVMLTSPSLRPQPAQAQTQTPPKTVLTIDGVEIAQFSSLNQAVSTIELPNQPQPFSIVLEKPANSNLQLHAWHQAARNQAVGYRRNATLTFVNSSGVTTQKLFISNAWPAEYRLTQQGDRVVEEVTLSADAFLRLQP